MLDVYVRAIEELPKAEAKGNVEKIYKENPFWKLWQNATSRPYTTGDLEEKTFIRDCK